MQRYLIGFLFNDEKKLSLLYHFAVVHENLLQFSAGARNDVHRCGRLHGADGLKHVGNVSCSGGDERDQRGADGAGLRFFGFAGAADQQRGADKTQKNSSGHGDSRGMLTYFVIVRREKICCQGKDGKDFLSKDCRALHKRREPFSWVHESGPSEDGVRICRRSVR